MASCKESGPQPVDMVGHYIVSANLSKKAINTDDIKNKISEAMEEAKDNISKSKDEIKKEFDLTMIDTSTVDGKIEYAAKKFGQSMAELGTDMGELGTEVGSLFSDLTSNGINFGESLLKNLKIEVELQADGDIKVDNTYVLLGLTNATWKVENDQFLLYKDKQEKPDTFLIKERNTEGFTLTKDELEILFVKNK
jgi:hypothetical protein